jgi:voltage-gated potassium channel
VLFPGADLRILRILRLTRLLKLSHYSTAIEDLASAIYAERRSFGAPKFGSKLRFRAGCVGAGLDISMG